MRKRDIVREVLLLPIQIHLFGAFGGIFNFRPHYLPFLNLRFDDSYSKVNLDISLNKLNRVFERKSISQIKSSITTLLKPINWRYHLVACVAIVKLNKKDQIQYCERLWELYLNEDYWLFPQVLATLSLIDPKFSEKIKTKEVLNAFSKNESLIYKLEELLNSESPIFWKKDIVDLIAIGRL